MVTGNFIIAYQKFSFGRSYCVKHPLGLQYIREDATGRVIPFLNDWIWGTDPMAIVKIDKQKVMTISRVNLRLHGMFIDFHTNLIKARFTAERLSQLARADAVSAGTENKSEERVDSPTFIGDEGLSEEQQIERAMKLKEFTKPLLH